MHETDDYSERKRKKRINIYAIANNQRIIVTAFSAEHTQTTIICGVINFCSYSINRWYFACESEAQADLSPEKVIINNRMCCSNSLAQEFHTFVLIYRRLFSNALSLAYHLQWNKRLYLFIKKAQMNAVEIKHFCIWLWDGSDSHCFGVNAKKVKLSTSLIQTVEKFLLIKR